jgi:D-galacturonate reductase
MEGGEVTADQCHRGYTLASDESDGLLSLNPLYIRNVPDTKGRYCGQSGYGYVSFERFVRAAAEINAGTKTPDDFDDELPTGRVTEAVTAILEAGRISLDNHGNKVALLYENINDRSQITKLQLMKV